MTNGNFTTIHPTNGDGEESHLTVKSLAHHHKDILTNLTALKMQEDMVTMDRLWNIKLYPS